MRFLSTDLGAAGSARDCSGYWHLQVTGSIPVDRIFFCTFFWSPHCYWQPCDLLIANADVMFHWTSIHQLKNKARLWSFLFLFTFLMIISAVLSAAMLLRNIISQKLSDFPESIDTLQQGVDSGW